MGPNRFQLVFALLICCSCLPEGYGQRRSRVGEWCPPQRSQQGQYCPPVPQHSLPQPIRQNELLLPPVPNGEQGNAAVGNSPTPPNNADPNAAVSPDNTATPDNNSPNNNAAQPNIQDQFNALANQPQNAQPLSADVALLGDSSAGAPNMIGDFLGLTNTSNLSLGSISPLPTTFGGAPLSGLAFSSTGAGTIDLFLPQGISIGGATLSNSITLGLSDSNSDGIFDAVTSPISAADRQALNSWLGQGGSTLTGSSGTFDIADANLEAEQLGGSANLIIDGNLLRGGFQGDSQILLPRTGTHVSRHKPSEQTSPIPRDRVFFNTSWFNGVPGVGGQQNVTRFIPGFEQTFDEGNSSIEVRLPFASTFDQLQTATDDVFLGATNTEFGNIAASYKKLIKQTDTFALSVGLSIELATSNDLVVENSLTRITRESESIHLLPFVGALFTPSDRFFMQSYMQFSFDTNGEQVHIEDFRSQQIGYGRLQEPTVLFADVAAGYWFYRNEHTSRPSQISGVAGILEVHMAQTIQDTDSLEQTVGGNDYSFGDPNGSLGVANLTAGATIELGKQSTVTVAYVTPLTDGDRQFDGELHLLLSYYFDGLGSSFRNLRR